jgi:hypothetical protein
MSLGARDDADSLVPVVCFGLGPIGLRLAERLVDQSGVEVIAGVDLDVVRTGDSLGAYMGRSDLAIPIVASLAEVEPRGGVLIQATVSELAPAVAQVLEAVKRGWNVVSTCEQLVCPSPDDAGLFDQVDQAAKQAGVSVLGAGINPGFLMDAMPLVVSAACTKVDSVVVKRVVDTNQRRVPLQQKAGVGLSVEEFDERRAAGRLGHVGLRQSAELIARGLGWTIDTYSETLEAVIAEAPSETGLGAVPVGGVLGQHQIAHAYQGEDLIVTFDLEMSAGANSVDQIDIAGVPTIHQSIMGGVNGDVGTVAVISNLVPVVAASRPGFLTMADVLPLRNIGPTTA